jgi:flagella basal body P-ring formation protein FlgA
MYYVLRNEKRYSVGGALLLLAAVVIGLVATFSVEPEQPVARSYTTGWYVEQGADKAVVASGGELEVQSGGTFDVQGGAVITLSGYVTSAVDSLTVTNTVQAEHLRSTDDAVIDDALTANSAAVTGTVQAEHLRSTDDAVIDDALTANSAAITGTVTTGGISVTAPITVSGYGFTYTAPITITGVLSNVRLLYYQIP